VTRIVLDIDDTRWKVTHLARVMRSAESEFLSELAAQVEIQVTDARPLIVLDLSVFISDAQLLADLRAPHVWDLNQIADQIEAQTKPARIPEPGHIGSLVTCAALGSRAVCVWTKYSEVTGTRNWISPGGVRREWDELDNPEPFPFGGLS
jgi:hypothetical protein